MLTLLKAPMEFVFNRFFSEKTELLYDYTADPQHPAMQYLPHPEQIRAHYPNPNGWGTGMEDSTLNGGSLLDALVGLYRVTEDPAVSRTALTIFRGLSRCVRIPGAPGYVARSISPEDGKTAYIGSSRDQYTHFVYAAWRLYEAPFCPEDVRGEIRELIVAVAEKCLRDVTEENDFCLLRTDGGRERVGCMWGKNAGDHEVLRLPMFYLAAYHISGESRWLKEYHRYLPEALERTVRFDPSKSRVYVSLQVQYSMVLVYTLDLETRPRLLPFMHTLADFCQNKALEQSRTFCAPENRSALNFRFRAWDAVEPWDIGPYEGLPFLNPAQSEYPENRAFYPVREVGEGAAVAAICPDRPIPPELKSAVENMLAAIDLCQHYSIYAPLLLCCGLMLLAEAGY